MYQQYPPLAEVSRLALDAVPFDDLPMEHHPVLAVAISISRGGYMPLLGQHATFVLRQWSKGELAGAFADKHFNTPQRADPLPFSDFLSWPRNTGPNGETVSSDPRVVADSLPLGTAPSTPEAPVAVAGNRIVDGYLRCILFYRDAAPSATLPIWVGQ